jgi:hypothetical protein
MLRVVSGQFYPARKRCASISQFGSSEASASSIRDIEPDRLEFIDPPLGDVCAIPWRSSEHAISHGEESCLPESSVKTPKRNPIGRWSVSAIPSSILFSGLSVDRAPPRRPLPEASTDQDLSGEAEALDKAIIAAVSKEPSKRDAAAEQKIKERLAVVAMERATLQKAFATEFPDYAALSNPLPIATASIGCVCWWWKKDKLCFCPNAGQLRLEGNPVKVRKVAEGSRDIGMIGTKRLLFDRQRALARLNGSPDESCWFAGDGWWLSTAETPTTAQAWPRAN